MKSEIAPPKLLNQLCRYECTYHLMEYVLNRLQFHVQCFTTQKKYPALPGKGAILKKCEHLSLQCHNKVLSSGVNTKKTTII